MDNLAQSDRNALSILQREKDITKLIELIEANSKTNIFHPPRTKILLIKYKDQWGERDRLGIVDYSSEQPKEYIFNRQGLEGSRNATVSFDKKTPILQTSPSIDSEMTIKQLENLPPIVYHLIPKITGYFTVFGGMEVQGSDKNPLMD